MKASPCRIHLGLHYQADPDRAAPLPVAGPDRRAAGIAADTVVAGTAAGTEAVAVAMATV